MKKLLSIMLYCNLLAFTSNAQQVERHKVEVAFVYNFAKNITWPNETQISEFHFLVITQDNLFRQEFDKLATKKIRGKSIKIHYTDKLDGPTDAQLIFADKEFESSLLDYFAKLEGKNTLLVTEKYNDRRFVMINITEPQPGKLHFEINKANILNHQLIILPEMILLGGTEIDVASLYKETQQSFLGMQKELDNLNASSKELREKIRLSEIEIEKQNKLSAQQDQLVQSQLKELASQENRLKVLQTEVKTNSLILKEKTQELADKENWLKEQEAQVEKANQVLRSLNTSIDSLNRQVREKEKVLNLQGYTIASQSKILYGLVVIITLAVIAVFLLLRWYRQKTKLNKLLTIKKRELETANEELLQTQEEIAAQRDIVSNQNKELAQSKIIIENQNQEIKERNLNLEAEVENRTKELVEYNQQLEQFAFISAHNLRAPVARILGLGHLLDISGNKNDPQVLEKLVLTTKELDRVVMDLNIILEIRKNNTTILSEINLDEEVELVKISLAREIAETKAIIKTDFGSIKSIRTIRPYLDSILVNLVSNAIKYRYANRNPEISLKACIRDNFICLTVKDNGLGIDLNLFKDKIFKLYSRFHDHVEGKGFGLYLVKTQVAAMGGRLEVESKVNEGTTFSIYLKMQ